MMLEIEKNDMLWQASVKGDLTIYQAADAYHAFKELRSAVAPLELNLSAVTALDSAGLQLLVMLKKHFVSQRQRIEVVACSEAVEDVLILCRLASYMGLTISAEASA